MDFFFFQLAIIFLPGLVWERIVTKGVHVRTRARRAHVFQA
jgi:hypothetical protein